MTEPVDLLAVAAHPDDTEVGCGGVLAICADAGLRVAVADLTSGESGTRGSREQRDHERMEAGRILGLCARPALGLPDAALGTEPGHREAIAGLLRDLKPRVVLAPYPEDRHPDHAAAGRLVREASFLAGLAKLGGERAHWTSYVFHYQIHHPFIPSFVIDITDVWERKMEAVRAYRTQFGPGEEGDGDVLGEALVRAVEARAAYHGAMIGAVRGEAFHSLGPLALSSLPGLEAGVGPGRAYNMFR